MISLYGDQRYMGQRVLYLKISDRQFRTFLDTQQMATSRGLTTALSSLSISPVCIRTIAPRVSHFSTTPAILGGPITRMRRERTQAKLKRAKARAEELRLQREVRADPIVGHSTEFTKSLLRPREILAQPGIASHTRAGEENWPMLTNFGISSDDALTLAVGAKAAEERRLKSGNVVMDSGEQILYHNVNEIIASKKAIQEKEDAQKREVIARLLDLTNANSKSVITANMEKAIIHFARHEGDTGSPEVQGSPRKRIG